MISELVTANGNVSVRKMANYHRCSFINFSAFLSTAKFEEITTIIVQVAVVTSQVHLKACTVTACPLIGLHIVLLHHRQPLGSQVAVSLSIIIRDQNFHLTSLLQYFLNLAVVRGFVSRIEKPHSLGRHLWC